MNIFFDELNPIIWLIAYVQDHDGSNSRFFGWIFVAVIASMAVLSWLVPLVGWGK